MYGNNTPIPDDLVPHCVDSLMAKSEDYGGETLAEHTWAVLCRLRDQMYLRPQMSEFDERLWYRMYQGAFLHDFGKAAAQFQERLQPDRPDNLWKYDRHRHEVLSLAFVDWLFPRGHIDRIVVIAVIASHHKNFDDIIDKYGLPEDEFCDEQVAFLSTQIDADTQKNLWQWLIDYNDAWREYLKIPAVNDHSVEFQKPRAWDAATLEASMHKALDDYRHLYNQHENQDAALNERHRFILRRGLIFAADHTASAGAGELPDLHYERQQVVESLPGLYMHQKQAEKGDTGSRLLIAPTGSGKTEAALLWVAQQKKLRAVARIFYTLPYQASMNAMAERLASKLYGVPLEDDEQNDQVTIQHSRATLAFYQRLLNADGGASDPKKLSTKARNLKDKARLNMYPIRVFSPYQMLKVGFQLKLYEALLLDFYNALFIFDEIHAYDAHRMALIITLMGWLRRHCEARFFVMTATLPPLVQKKLVEALDLNEANIIQADETMYQKSQRHVVHLLDGTMFDQTGEILAVYEQGESVLVVCNQVARAQEMYTALKTASPHLIPDRAGDEDNERLPDIVLLHGRFNGEDRSRKETFLAEAVGTNVPLDIRRPVIVVSTQVVEVSLDVDFDRLYSEPAPLEALLQRFGRVNRKNTRVQKAPVFIVRDPQDDEGALPYDGYLVRRSMEVLDEYLDGMPVDEGQVTTLLEHVYADEQLHNDWLAKYNHHADEFEQILNKMMPFESGEHDYLFYQLFDGRQVVPADQYDDFLDEWEQASFLSASRYMVNISNGRFHALRGRGLAVPRDGEDVPVDTVNVPYDPELGLDFNAVSDERDTNI